MNILLYGKTRICSRVAWLNNLANICCQLGIGDHDKIGNASYPFFLVWTTRHFFSLTEEVCLCV